MPRPILVLIAGAAALSGCVSVPKLGDPPAPAAAGAMASAQSFAAPAADWPADRWWTAYGDGQLTTLVDEALAGSPGLQQARARLDAADARRRVALGATRPTVYASGQAGEGKQSYNNGIPPQFIPRGYRDSGRLTADMTWDLDLWGRNRAALAAAVSEAEAARMDLAQARLVLTTAIVSAYADFTRLTAERDGAEAAVKNRQATADLVARRVEGGAANRGEAAQAAAAAAAARQELAALDEQLVLARDQLAALAGRGPDRGLALGRPAARPDQGFGLPGRLAADLLGRRPDLQAARLRAEAAGRRIDVARAGFYPNVNLAAFIGVQSLGLSNLTDAGSDIGQSGLAVTLPILRGQRLVGEYRGARAEYEAAVAAYDQTLVTALREVADAAAGQRALEGRLTAARQALASAQQAYEIARQRYSGGLSTYLTLLSAEDQVIAQRRTVAQLEARALSLDAGLVRALGGGFRA